MWREARSLAWEASRICLSRRANSKVATVSSLPLQQQVDSKDSYRDQGDAASPGSQRLSSCSSWHPWMKWWTDCCDQLCPGFKTSQLQVTQQCTSSTPPPISHNCRNIDGSDLHSNGGGKKYPPRRHTDWQNRPLICCPLSKSADLSAKRMAKLAACCPV